MVRIDGPAVADLSDCFTLSWKRLRGAPLRLVGFPAAPPRRGASVQAVRVLGQQFLRTQRQISRAYVHYLQRAQRRVFIANSYFVRTAAFCARCRGPRGAGVDVRIIVPGQSDVGHRAPR